MHFSRYLRILRKRWWLILLVVIVSTSTATFYTLRQPPIYRSTVTLLLSPGTNTGALIPLSPVSASAQLAETYIYYLQTKTFAESVIQSEQLDITPDALIESVKARMIEGTQFFEINATANSAEGAQFLAAAIANNFIRQNIARQQAEVSARRSTGDVDNVNALLAEKLERERSYFEEQVGNLRIEVDRLRSQPPSTVRDEQLAAVQTQLSADEEKLMQIMSDQVSLQPPIDEGQITTVSVAEPATLPARPLNGAGLNTIAYALLASLLLGGALAFGLEYLDYTVHSPEDVEETVGVSPLGVLATVLPDPTRSTHSGRVADDVVVLSQPRAPTAEAFRALVTNLRFSGAGRQLQSLVVTSAGPGEGKSVIAANLAVAFAQSGRRVLLIDADMRRPTVHERFHLTRQLGLSSLLIADDATSPAVIEQYLQPGPVETLRIMTSGPIPPNPAELLGATWAADIFDAVEAQADIVIWDTPPALTVTDAVILAARADATLQVIQAGSTRRDLAVKTRDVLHRVGANVLAPVLNRVKVRDVGYYQYYYYYYRKDGQGYSRDEAPAPDVPAVNGHGPDGGHDRTTSANGATPTSESDVIITDLEQARRSTRRRRNPLQR